MFIYPVTWVTFHLLKIAVHISGCCLGRPCITMNEAVMDLRVTGQAGEEGNWLAILWQIGRHYQVIITKGPPQDHQRPEWGRILFLLTLQLESVSSVTALLSRLSLSPSPGIQQVPLGPLSWDSHLPRGGRGAALSFPVHRGEHNIAIG